MLSTIFPAPWNKESMKFCQVVNMFFLLLGSHFLYFEIHVTKAGVGQSRRKSLSQNPEETGFPSNIQEKTRIL